MKNVIANIDTRKSISIAGASEQNAQMPIGSAILYALIYIVAAASISFFLSVAILPGRTKPLSVIAPAGCFAFIGLLFATLLYTRLRFLSRSDYNGGIVYAALVFAGVFTASLATGLFKGNGSVTTSLFYSSLFILPFTVYQSWLYYSKLLFYSYSKIWYLPERVAQQPRRATIFLNSIHIKIKIPPVQGGAEYVYETTVPGRMSVGEMFNDLVNTKTSADSTDAFEEVGSNNYGWQFFVPAFLGISSRQVDADASLDLNKIKNNGIVIAKRVPRQFAITEITNQN